MVVTAGMPIIRLIKPESTPTIAVMLGVGLYQFILMFRNCYASFFSCTYRIPHVTAYILSSIVCVTAALLLRFTALGVWALILSQFTSQAVFNAVVLAGQGPPRAGAVRRRNAEAGGWRTHRID